MSDAPRAGWYPDPRDPALWRWWNGADWTADTAQRPPVAAAAAAAPAVTAAPVVPAAPTLAYVPPADPEPPVRRVLDWSDAAPSGYRSSADTRPATRPPAGWTWFMVFGGYVYAIFAAVFQVVAFTLVGYPVPAGSAAGVDYGQSNLLLLVSLGAWAVAVIPMIVLAELDGRSLKAHGVAAPSGLLMFLLPNVVYYLVRRSRLGRAGVHFKAADITFFIVYGLQAVSFVFGVVMLMAILPLLLGLR